MAEKKSGKEVSHEGHRQRMKARFLNGGLDGFSGHEVLEMLLFYALPYRDTNGLGHLLEDRFGGLSKVLEADYADLVQVPGITPHVATLLTFCGQLCRRYQKEQYLLGNQLYDTNTLSEYIKPWFTGQKDESVVLVSMDNKRKLLNATRIFEGSVNAAQFNPRLAVRQALQDNATLVALAHNHPSGFAIPSRADIETTLHFSKVLATVEITLIDHLVVSEGDCISMACTPETAHLFPRPGPAILRRMVADED